MRGKLIRFPLLARRRNRMTVASEVTPVEKKSWLVRLWNKTAAPFWFRRVRRQLRHSYRNTVAFRMWLVSKWVYRIEAHGLDNYSYSPSTIIACTHKRDMDLPVIIPLLYLFKRPGRLKDMRLMYIATRDDLIEEGFLMVYFPWLNFFRPALSKLRLKRFFQILQASPVKLPDEQTVNQLLHETRRIEGDLPLAENLTPEWRAKLLGAAANRPGQTLRDAILKAPLKTLSQYATPRIFNEPLAGRIRQRHFETALKQLYDLTRIIEKGGTLIVLPEGKVTPDGRFSKMRAAVMRLITQSRVDTKLLPVNITYDYMDTAKANVTVNVGPEIDNLKHLPKTELAELIRNTVTGLATVTLSGIISRLLIGLVGQGIEEIELNELREQTWAEVQRLRRLGLALDRQLATRQEFELRFERFLAYAWKTGGIFLPMEASRPTTLRLDLPALRREECTKHNDNPVRYCYNELTELLATQQALPASETTPGAAPVADFVLAAKRRARTAG